MHPPTWLCVCSLAPCTQSHSNNLTNPKQQCWHDSGDVSVEMVMGHMRANAVNARRFIAAVLDELSKEEHADLVQAKHLAGGRKFGISTYTEGRSPKAVEKLNWLFEGYF